MSVIYPVPVKIPSGISSWDAWPDDVRDIIRRWNKRIWVGLSFTRSRFTFKCADCAEFCLAHGNGAAVFNGTTWVCDDCLIARARRYRPLYERLGEARRAGRFHYGCICQRCVDGLCTYDLGTESACSYHRTAAEFPLDHQIPWNCPTFYDGCNCTGDPQVSRQAATDATVLEQPGA